MRIIAGHQERTSGGGWEREGQMQGHKQNDKAKDDMTNERKGKDVGNSGGTTSRKIIL